MIKALVSEYSNVYIWHLFMLIYSLKLFVTKTQTRCSDFIRGL